MPSLGRSLAIRRKYIAVAGNIGAGKSTLVHFLHQKFNAKPFYEPNEQNPYLSDFYSNMADWSFHSQIFFLTHKFRIHNEVEKTTGRVVIDRTIYEDAEVFGLNLFERGQMSQRDFNTYWSLYESMRAALLPPDLMIYLRCSIDTLQKRIAERGRVMEREIPLSYLEQLQRLYDTWIERSLFGEVLVVNTDDLDYNQNLSHQQDVMKLIEKHLG